MNFLQQFRMHILRNSQQIFSEQNVINDLAVLQFSAMQLELVFAYSLSILIAKLIRSVDIFYSLIEINFRFDSQNILRACISVTSDQPDQPNIDQYRTVSRAVVDTLAIQRAFVSKTHVVLHLLSTSALNFQLEYTHMIRSMQTHNISSKLINLTIDVQTI